MSAVTVSEDGIVAAKEVAEAVAGIMCALKQLESRQHQSMEDASVNEFRASRQAEGLAKVAGLNAEEFKVRAAGGGRRGRWGSGRGKRRRWVPGDLYAWSSPSSRC